jgi:hypothetical protein
MPDIDRHSGMDAQMNEPDYFPPDVLINSIHDMFDAIAEAVAAEREAILAIVEREHECRCFGRLQGPPDLCDGCKKNALRKEIAAAIRARSSHAT